MLNDADIETVELADAATETEAETCRACGRIGAAVTLLRAGRAGNRVEVYECVCGHVSAWLNHRRMS
jgi:DNA-directed RNA polymerase subunit M/transcription elongation factor TFIIS